MACEFSVSILSSKRPLDDSTLGVDALLPSGNLGAKRWPIWQTLTKTLTSEPQTPAFWKTITRFGDSCDLWWSEHVVS